MLQDTAQRLDGLSPTIAKRPPLIVCNAEHRFLAAQQMQEVGITGVSLVLEPVGRNTAPALTLAALAAPADCRGVTVDPNMLVGKGAIANLSLDVDRGTLFRATLNLPADVPVGTHRARAFLFKHGSFAGETSSTLVIRKAGFEQSVYDIAHQYSMFYGLFAVELAMVTGWLGRMIFRRD